MDILNVIGVGAVLWRILLFLFAEQAGSQPGWVWTPFGLWTQHQFCFKTFIDLVWLCMSSSQEAGAGRSGVKGQPRLHSKILTQKQNRNFVVLSRSQSQN
jgi:hypothetical protein